MAAKKRDPDVFVVLKEGDSHGTRAGTPLCVELDERSARHSKVGRCVRYAPADQTTADARADGRREAAQHAVKLYRALGHTPVEMERFVNEMAQFCTSS